MKRLIYMLLLFVVLGHTVFAQEQKAEPLEVRLLDGFFPLGADWYRAQKDAWQVELKKDKRNEKAWENYWVACNAEYQEAKLVWWKDSLQVQRLRREQHGIVKKMKKWIPDTRTYYRHLLDLETDEGKREVIQQKILSIKRTSERDYISDLTYYHHKKYMDKIKELAREWYDSGLFSHAFLFYFYNECSGLKKDAILVSDLNLGTYYRYLLQYGIGLFTDVKVVDVADLRNPTQESQLWQEVGIDVQTLPDAKTVRCPGLWYFAEKEKRPVYYTHFFYRRDLLEEMKDSLYSEGLVFRYSSKPYNNLAATRKNFEQNYLLDYLRHPLIEDQSHFSSGIHILGNYIIAFSPLLRFYQMSGDKNQYIRLKSLLQSILDYSTTPRRIANVEMNKYVKPDGCDFCLYR
ncbi:hypothetical protein NXX60_17270 [Bacteroides thetaiotaomicron]|nr:hypothetical protein NXX60_17270 [Bacteroides thetaiotaomicron]